MHFETYTKKLDRRAWKGRLVGYSLERESFRVYNPETRSIREIRNFTFTETPSVMPEPDLVIRFDGGDFACNEYDDMVRDVRTYTSNLDLSSPPAADRHIQDLSVRGLLKNIRETTNRDAAVNCSSLEPPENPSEDNPSDNSPGGDSSASREQGSPTGSGGGPEWKGSFGISASGAASRSGCGSHGGSASRGGRGARGGRGRTALRCGRDGSTPQHPTTRSVALVPNAQTIREMRRPA